jgi:hypothetical protein
MEGAAMWAPFLEHAWQETVSQPPTHAFFYLQNILPSAQEELFTEQPVSDGVTL